MKKTLFLFTILTIFTLTGIHSLHATDQESDPMSESVFIKAKLPFKPDPRAVMKIFSRDRYANLRMEDNVRKQGKYYYAVYSSTSVVLPGLNNGLLRKVVKIVNKDTKVEMEGNVIDVTFDGDGRKFSGRVEEWRNLSNPN